jgi:hypothetical protein
MRTPRLPVVDITNARADLNGLVHFSERRNLLSARVPLSFKCSSLISFSGWVDPRAIVRPEGLYQWKIPTTPTAIETANFRLVTLPQLTVPSHAPSKTTVGTSDLASLILIVDMFITLRNHTCKMRRDCDLFTIITGPSSNHLSQSILLFFLVLKNNIKFLLFQRQ